MILLFPKVKNEVPKHQRGAVQRDTWGVEVPPPSGLRDFAFPIPLQTGYPSFLAPRGQEQWGSGQDSEGGW